MKRLTIATVAAAAVTGATLTIPANAAEDVSLTSTIKNHADNGHGTPPHWADDNWTRTTAIHDNGDGTFAVTLTGTGTFTTIKGAGAPNGTGSITRKTKGVFTEHLTATVEGKLKGKTALNNMNNKIFNDKTKIHYTTSAWLKAPFKTATSVHIDSYTYEYKNGTCEHWVDADSNNDGQDPSAGTITGKKCPAAPFVPSALKAVAKCRVSKADKREIWTVTNVQGGRDRQFWAWVWSPNPHPGQRADGWYHLPNGHGSYTVKAGQSVDIMSGWGGVLSVGHYDGQGNWLKTRAVSDHRVTCK